MPDDTRGKASDSEYCINAQLEKLHSSAKDLIKSLDSSINHRSAHSDCGSVLYTFTATSSSTSEPTFQATFNAPSIHFVCNHYAILNLHLADGHYKAPPKAGTQYFFHALLFIFI